MLAIIEPRAIQPVKTPPGQPPKVTGPAAVEMDARPTVDAVLRIGAARNLADPYRMGLLLFPSDPFSICDRPIENIRFNIQDRIRAAGENARADACDGGRRFEFADLEALRQAELAVSDDRAWAVAMKRWR